MGNKGVKGVKNVVIVLFGAWMLCVGLVKQGTAS